MKKFYNFLIMCLFIITVNIIILSYANTSNKYWENGYIDSIEYGDKYKL